MSRPLEGLLVVAIEQAVAGPLCTARLADAGARVIKIERPEGDFARGYDTAAKGDSSYFAWLNQGKQSVVLNYREYSTPCSLRPISSCKTWRRAHWNARALVRKTYVKNTQGSSRATSQVTVTATSYTQ